MTRLISLALSLTMLFGSGAAPASVQVTVNVPITVGKQQAVYEKYNTKTELYDGYVLNFGSNSTSCSASTGYYAYKFDEINGTVSGVGQLESIYREQSTTFYVIVNNKDIRKVVQDYDPSRDTASQRWVSGSIWKQKLQIEACGDYISDVVANTGSRPADGKHTDGYWYVFKNLVED